MKLVGEKVVRLERTTQQERAEDRYRNTGKSFAPSDNGGRPPCGLATPEDTRRDVAPQSALNEDGMESGCGVQSGGKKESTWISWIEKKLGRKQN